MSTETTAGEKFQRLCDIMARLRGEGGCPWDREQTFDSIKPYTLEETYEVLDAIDRRDWPNLAEELGDFMLQAVFFAQMASEQKLFRMEDALDAINQKLVRRHPHIFGTEEAETAGDVKRIWGEVKAAEKKAKGKPDETLLGPVPRALPALMEAQQIAGRAAAVGFDWENTEQVIEKLDEELGGTGRGAAQRGPGGTGRRDGGHSVRAGEPGAVREGGPGAGAAPLQCQVPAALRLHRTQAGRTGQDAARSGHGRDGSVVAGGEGGHGRG